ncbi:S9 family peptidase [Nibrella saemangeumensis]|uniref:S9 family peptidase n=1 Tax=Nibrella saemangeumensis TaxID=1084526 RepID=A0ABP8MPJ1_9BACT
MRKLAVAWLWLSLTVPVTAQTKRQITLDEVWGQNAFAQKTVAGVNWMKAGGYYTSLESGRVVRYSIASGQAAETLFDEKQAKTEAGQAIQIEDYQLSADERKLLITTDEEQIYRRSSKAEFYMYDLDTKKLTRLSAKGKQMYATFSPNGRKVAFIRDNNLFVTDLGTMTETQLTTDGKRNEIINGAADWVYEEEFSMSRAFDWSPDSRRIAWQRFDESRVPEFNMQRWGSLYPADYRFKYPKAGEANAIVTIWVIDLDKQKKVQIDTGTETDMYLPRIRWTQNPNLLSVRRLNRLQNRLDLLHADAMTGKTSIVLTEKSPTYVDLELTDDLTYLQDGKTFLNSSERNGYKHLYLHDMSGKAIRQLTTGNWEVDNVLGVDETSKVVYFTSTEVSPMERHLYRVGLDGKNKIRLTPQAGTHSINMSPDYSYYLQYHTTTASPYTVSVQQAPRGKETAAKLVRTAENNDALKARLQEYSISPKRFFQFTTSENVSLNGWMIRPVNFDSTRRYPVLMFVYGGPGSQQVRNTWEARDFFWYQTLAQKGYLMVCVDNRGTGGRGKDFRTVTYGQLGKLETQDQIEGAKYLGTLPYVDKSRIGIWGWSFGGYMSALCMTIGADYFKAGISVAPVTTWRFYDTIYTERFLKRPQDNPSGYDDNSPLTHAAKLKGNFLLIHGTGDDNVHFQNAVAFQDALIKAGKQFQSFYYPNRAHGISGGNTRLHLYRMMTDFVEKNL